MTNVPVTGNNMCDVLVAKHQTERLEALGRLAGGVAHDFNNLLAVLSGTLELLNDEVPQENTCAKHLLAQAQATVQRGVGLTRRLLQFGRSEEQGDMLRPIALRSFLSGIWEILEQSVRGEAGICSLIMEPCAIDMPEVMSDPHQLEMALLNLCVNARDAMPRGGVVRIGMRVVMVQESQHDVPDLCCAEQAVALDVKDEGEGMPPDVMVRVFEPFFTTKTSGRGTGLGLSGVCGFMRRSYGKVLVDSEPGSGTCVTLLLPMLKPVPG